MYPWYTYDICMISILYPCKMIHTVQCYWWLPMNITYTHYIPIIYQEMTYPCCFFLIIQGRTHVFHHLQAGVTWPVVHASSSSRPRSRCWPWASAMAYHGHAKMSWKGEETSTIVWYMMGILYESYGYIIWLKYIMVYDIHTIVYNKQLWVYNRYIGI